MSSNMTNTSYYTVPVEIVNMVKKVVFLGIVPFLIVSGLTLNSFCIAMFYRLKKLTSTVIMLSALAVTDNFILLVGAMNCLSIASSYYETPLTHQQRILMVPYFSSYISPIPARIGNFLTLSISVERLCSVLMPMKVKQYFTKKSAIVAVILSYVMAFGLSIPILFYYETEEIYSNTTSVVILKTTTLGKNEEFTEGYYIMMQTLFKYIPVLGVMITSFATGSIVFVSARRRSKMAEGNISSSIQELQVTKTLLVVTFTFLICQLPTSIVMVIIMVGMKPYKYTSNVYEIAMAVTYVPMVINSAVNFIIYYTTSQVYKKHIIEMLRCYPVKTTNKKEKQKITTKRENRNLQAKVYTVE